MNSWKSVSFSKDLINDITKKVKNITGKIFYEYHLIIGGNVIAKTTYSQTYDNFIKPLFFLNIFDMPFVDHHSMSLEIRFKPSRNSFAQKIVLKENELVFEPGHHLTKRNPDKEILIEYYDKSFDDQINRNVLIFCNKIMGKLYIGNLNSEELILKYKKLVNKMKY